MAQTVLTGATPYCSAAQALVFHDARQWGDLIPDTDARASSATLTSGAGAGATLVTLLQAASGELEEWCLKGGRYTPTDLAALTGNSAARLQEVVADLAFWRASKRRWPKLRREDVPGAYAAEQALGRLGSGETIFGFQESADAGNPSVVTLDPGDDRRTVRAASRYFGSREPRGLGGSG